jgi:hypothetical protein
MLIAHHRIAQLLGHGEADARLAVVFPVARLHDATASGAHKRVCGGKKVLPPLEMFHQ